MAYAEVGHAMPWSEAERLVDVILRDTSSVLSTAMAGWQYPMSRESLILSDLYDLLLYANAGKKAQGGEYPRPWLPYTSTRLGRTAGRSRADVEALLGQFGSPDSTAPS